MTDQSGERERLEEAWGQGAPWLRWGPYLSERQWGTVREDYSADGTAWSSFPHDHARARAYRWGEDGLAGLSDDRQRLCFALALWNGADAILKERLFGLTNDEGNHGEDVKEYYFYLDNTPTHSYMRYLYKYPQRAFPYAALVEENRRRKADPGSFEYELLDTGVFDEDRYYDVEVEYAKRGPEDILVRITATNRGPDAHLLTLLPTLWFRNDWSWGEGTGKPLVRAAPGDGGPNSVIHAEHRELGAMLLVCEEPDELLLVDNETNSRRLYGVESGSAHPKDGIHDYVVAGRLDAVAPERRGTKAAALYRRIVPAGGRVVVRLRLTAQAEARTLGEDFDSVLAMRQEEAAAFYGGLLPDGTSEDRRAIHRQALAGLLWSKQVYRYVVADWLRGDQMPPPNGRRRGRNARWTHLYAEDVLCMPDTWEYPWFASWDLCFHAVALGLVDPGSAKQQLGLLAREWYMSPEGQIPAYEWAFEDVNPPLHPWAAWRLYRDEKTATGAGDLTFLKAIFHRCLMYFTWWVNRKDADGNNLFQGGFLGLDNIGVFDRSDTRLPPGCRLYQSDGTSWMGFFALQMMEIALELAHDDPGYLDLAGKFFQHFLYIADAMNGIAALSEGEVDLWSEGDGFYFDVLKHGGNFEPMKVYSLVGLLPLLPVSALDLSLIEAESHAAFKDRVDWLARSQPQLVAQASGRDHLASETLLLSFVDARRLRRLLARMLDEGEFLGPHGLRSVSRRHQREPFMTEIDGTRYGIDYEPAESRSGLFGGNSNWRGPVWFPINLLLIEALRRFHRHFGPSFTVECPTGSGVAMTLDEVADELCRRLIAVFERDARGRRPVFGGTARFQADPHWRDHILFHEYFHGDNGAGLGASHQTGWTALVAWLIQRQAHRGDRG